MEEAANASYAKASQTTLQMDGERQTAVKIRQKPSARHTIYNDMKPKQQQQQWQQLRRIKRKIKMPKQ